MAEVKLQATKRDATGKGAARRSRASGKVPGILYGRGMDPVALEVDRRAFVTALHTDAGMNVLLDIEIDGSRTLALTRELQQDPVRGTLLHADFVKVDRTQEIEVDVRVQIIGESPGQKEGGVLEQPLHQVAVRCLPTDVPEAVEADISTLGIGDSLRVSDLAVGREFQILNDPGGVAIAAPISEEELEAMEAEAGVVHEPTEEELAAAEAAAAAEAEEVPEGEAPPAEEEQPAQEPGEGE
jgi:large subunit ribosomal protein L25